MIGAYNASMVAARSGRKGVVGRLSQELFSQFKVFCIENGLSVERAIEIAIQWQLQEKYTRSPSGEDTQTNAT